MSIELKSTNKIVKLKNGVEFHIRPEKFSDINAVFDWTKESGIPDENRSAVQTYTTASYGFMLRIEKWKGIKMNGKNAPCTMENKQLLFGQNPELMIEVMEEYAKDVEADSKN